VNRITPEEVVTAYKETGLRPGRGAYFPDDGCACGLGVLYYRDKPDHMGTITAYFDNKLGYDYRLGFVVGFDGEYFGYGVIGKPSDDYKVGYEDGRACWQACVEAGLVS
jgi:hypothetical protein